MSSSYIASSDQSLISYLCFSAQAVLSVISNPASVLWSSSHWSGWSGRTLADRRKRVPGRTHNAPVLQKEETQRGISEETRISSLPGERVCSCYSVYQLISMHHFTTAKFPDAGADYYIDILHSTIALRKPEAIFMCFWNSSEIHMCLFQINPLTVISCPLVQRGRCWWHTGHLSLWAFGGECVV